MKSLFYLLVSLGLFAAFWGCSTEHEKDEQVARRSQAEEKQWQMIEYLRDSLARTVNVLETPEVGEEFIERSVAYAAAHSQDTSSALLYFEAANVANSLRKYRRAVELWGKVWQLYPETEVAPHALFRQGFTTENSIKDRHKARYYYELFLQKYPSHEFVSGVRQLLMVLDRDPEEMVKQFEQQNQTQ